MALHVVCVLFLASYCHFLNLSLLFLFYLWGLNKNNNVLNTAE